MEQVLSFGAEISQEDYRTVVADKVTGNLPNTIGKVDLNHVATNDLCNQRQLGICTACATRMSAENHFKDGIRLCEEWLYLIGKVLVDGNLNEGSSAFTMLKASNKYGIPEKIILDTFDLKTDGSYSDFINHFQTKYGGKIPQTILDNAFKHKIPGYYRVNVDPISIAREIEAGKLPIIRLAVGENMYTAADGNVSWQAKDLLPLRAPKQVQGGHLMVLNEYNGLRNDQLDTGPNSWSKNWARTGYFDFHFHTQNPYFTEVWGISNQEIVIDKIPPFLKDLNYLMTDKDVKYLQKFLNTHGSPIASNGPGSLGNETTYFGKLTLNAVIKFQKDNNINPPAGFVGPITRGRMNLILQAE